MQKRKYIWMSLVFVIVLSGLVVQSAYAGKFHFNNIASRLGSIVMRGTLTGLETETAQVTLTGIGAVTALCEDDEGNQASGNKPVGITVSESKSFSVRRLGEIRIEIRVNEPSFSQYSPKPTPEQAGCPNGYDSVVDFVELSTDWKAANVKVKDEAGIVQVDLDFACTTTFEDGEAVLVKCQQT